MNREFSTSVNILKIEDFLLVSPQIAFHDSMAEGFKDEVLNRIKDAGSKGLIIDLTAIDVVDSFLGRVISEVAVSASLIGAKTMLTGLRPAVAMTMVEMGLSLKGVETALNLEKGIKLLRGILGS